VFYVLNEKGEPVEVEHFPAELYEAKNEDRQVALTELESASVSTVFLGIDHGFSDGPPVLFETMSFPDETQERYHTLKEAIAGHRRHVTRLFGGDPPETRWGNVVVRMSDGTIKRLGVTVWERLAGPDWI
jgi:hypothetical protein